MKTLIISVDYPLPEDRGNRMRTMHFVRCFSRYGDVDLMCYKTHVPDQPLETPFRKEFHIELNKDKAVSPSSSFLRLRRKLIECKPWIVNNYTDSTVKQVHTIITEENYDVILCRYSVNAYPLLSLPEKYKKRVILDIDDLMSGELYDAINGEKKGLTKIKAALDKIIFKKYQSKCLELGKVIFCSETDRTLMGKKSNSANMFVVPNIVPKQSIPGNYKLDGFNNHSLLFVGSLSYMPNEMGITWFIKEIFTKLPEQFQDIRLLVIGRNPQGRLIELCSRYKQIELIANPPDVVPYIEKSLAIIVPVMVGGGTRIKILEAGDCYRPVISTPLGAYGLDLREFKDILLFEDYKTFVNNLLWLKDKNNYDKLVYNLNKEVVSKYTEQAFNQKVDELLKVELIY